jgi:hypothetical protein
VAEVAVAEVVEMPDSNQPRPAAVISLRPRSVSVGPGSVGISQAHKRSQAEYISEEELAYMAAHGDAVMYPKLVKKTG